MKIPCDGCLIYALCTNQIREEGLDSIATLIIRCSTIKKFVFGVPEVEKFKKRLNDLREFHGLERKKEHTISETAYYIFHEDDETHGKKIKKVHENDVTPRKGY